MFKNKKKKFPFGLKNFDGRCIASSLTKTYLYECEGSFQEFLEAEKKDIEEAYNFLDSVYSSNKNNQNSR